MAASILIVDDDHAISRLLQLTLGLEGYDVTHRSSPDDALVAARESLPDLVITDIMMPGYDAGEFVTDLRALGFDGPIVVCTGVDGDIDLPVQRILRKPFDPDQLVELVASLVTP